EVRVVFCGAGAAGFATAKHFVALGVLKENLILTDIDGVVYRGRENNGYLEELASDTDKRTLPEALEGADAFVGVSVGGLLSPEMLTSMAKDPIVFALANPTPEIAYNLARQTRPDVIMATGRSDYPNQINNVIAFPYIFRGALDVRARAVNEAIKIATTRAIAALAKAPVPQEVLADSPGLTFGPDYIIPKPFDPRLRVELPVAIAAAAMETGLARRPVDLDAYRLRLSATLAP
ncbi:MAG: malic enzyme-like NAD(P)-binding protein, partial [Myxococcota bacterium]|nr:malic enzyme-like NAD(P)-binding protein [Myxococcota bacterium]